MVMRSDHLGCCAGVGFRVQVHVLPFFTCCLVGPLTYMVSYVVLCALFELPSLRSWVHASNRGYVPWLLASSNRLLYNRECQVYIARYRMVSTKNKPYMNTESMLGCLTPGKGDVALTTVA
jgi:hypothetical protein